MCAVFFSCSISYFVPAYFCFNQFFYCINFAKLNDNSTCRGSLSREKAQEGVDDVAYNKKKYIEKIRFDIFRAFFLPSSFICLFSVNESFESFMCTKVFGFSHIFIFIYLIIDSCFSSFPSMSNAI